MDKRLFGEERRKWPAIVLEVRVDWGEYRGLDLDEALIPATRLAEWLGVSWDEAIKLFAHAGVRRDFTGLSTLLGESVIVTLGSVARFLAEEAGHGRAA